MSTAYHQLYIDDLMALAKTLVIKVDEHAQVVNRYCDLLGYASNTTEPWTWKYYLNMAGEYHRADKVMTVTSLDTLQTIEFTKENLTIHRTTKREYQVGGQFYKELLRRFPEQEKLINGIINPVDIMAVKPWERPDGSIIWYNSDLVEFNEVNLIPELELWCQRAYIRWYIPLYAYTENLYAAFVYGSLVANIPNQIHAIRLSNCKTERAHTFHIRMYLASHGKLDTFIDNLTKKQQLYLYRNILRLNRHAGKQETHDELVQHVLTERGLPLAQWDIRHNISEQPNEILPKAEMYRTQINFGVESSGADTRSIGRMLEAEAPLARDNAKVQAQAEIDITAEIQGSRFNDLPTKILESSVIDMSDATPYTLSDALLNHWMYWSHSGRYTTFLAVADPKTGTSMRIQAKEAFLLWLWAYNKARGVDLPRLPRIEAWRVLRDPAPTKAELATIYDAKYVKDEIIESMYARLPVLPDSIISSSTFYDTVSLVHRHTMHQRNLWSYQEHMVSRGMVEGIAHRFYYDVPLNFGTDVFYEDWLVENNLSMDQYGASELELLANNILKAATGLDTINALSLRELQASMVRLFTQLSSYSIQVLADINTSALKMTDIADIRIGDDMTIAGDMIYNDKMPVRVLNVDSRASHEIDYDIIGDLVEFKVESTIKQEVSVDVTVDVTDDTRVEFVNNVDVVAATVTVVDENFKTLDQAVQTRVLTGYSTTARQSANDLRTFPQHYLNLSASDAIMLQMNAANETFLFPHNATIERRGTLGPGRAQVKVTAKPVRSLAEVGFYSGVVELDVKLLDIGTYFQGTVMQWDEPNRPLDTYELVDWLVKKFDLQIDREEFEFEAIDQNATTHTLRASSKSLRWTGSVAITIPASTFFSAIRRLFG